MKNIIVFVLILNVVRFAYAEEHNEFNPFAANVAETLNNMDQEYKNETGLPAFLGRQVFIESTTPSCRRMECHVFIDIEKSKQILNLYVDGVLKISTPTSTGKPGFKTPDFDTNPNGRIYRVYSSTKYPGYNNMPFAVFIQGGFAIHGAPGSEDAHLGQVASHGCVRIRTTVAEELNEIVSEAVKENGNSTSSVWITVRD